MNSVHETATDIVVIGAGLTGLTAAHYLQNWKNRTKQVG